MRAPGPGARAAAPGKVLVLGYAAIGDLIFFLPTLRALRRGFPGAKIVFVADRYAGTSEILPASGLVDDLWLYEHEELAARGTRREIERRVGAEGFDAVAATGATPMRAFAGAVLSVPTRAGHCRPIRAPHAGWGPLRYAAWRLRRGVVCEEFERRLAFNRKVWTAPGAEHAVRRNLRLAQALGLSLRQEDEARPELPEPAAARDFAERHLPRGKRFLGLHLGSPRSQYAKIWPAQRWAAVARAVVAKTGASLVLLGGPEETDAARAFAAACGEPLIDLTGRAGILETFAALRRCEAFLASDTGLAKAAMALGVPTATVWGPTDPRELGRIWDAERHLDVSKSLPCSPCVGLGVRNEGFDVLHFDNCGHRACLGELAAEEVAAKVLAWLEAR